MAHSYIDAIADAGADAVKFQTHIASEESTLDEPFRKRFSSQDASRYAYWERMEFDLSQWKELAEHAERRSLIFLSSAFSEAAVNLLTEVGMPAWKVGSGEYRSLALLEAMRATGRPVLLSTGMSRWEEIDRVIERLGALPHMLFQCTSTYPTSLKDVGLNVLDSFRRRYGCPVGLSDHSGTPFPALAALASGADAIEVHVCFDRGLFGPDAQASVTMSELAFLCRARDAFEEMKQHPVDKGDVADRLEGMRDIFSKSLAPARDLKAGEVITSGLLKPKKPGTGIPEGELGNVLGRKLLRDVPANRLLRFEDLAGE